MESLRRQVPVWIMTALVAMGVLGLLFLTHTERPPVFYAANILMHIPLLAGWLYLSLRKKPEYRLNAFWTPYSFFMILWVTTTVLLTAVRDHGAIGLLHLSETFWYALAYGLLFAFYRLESAQPLWYFMVFIAVFWNMQTVMLVLQAFGVELTMEGPPTFQSYFHSTNFWDSWGWFISDMLLDIPMAALALYFILRGIHRRVSSRIRAVTNRSIPFFSI